MGSLRELHHTNIYDYSEKDISNKMFNQFNWFCQGLIEYLYTKIQDKATKEGSTLSRLIEVKLGEKAGYYLNRTQSFLITSVSPSVQIDLTILAKFLLDIKFDKPLHFCAHIDFTFQNNCDPLIRNMANELCDQGRSWMQERDKQNICAWEDLEKVVEPISNYKE